MNWEAAGAIGEIVGAAAVVLTLAYLATQIRQTRVLERNRTSREMMEKGIEIMVFTSSNPGTLEPLRNGVVDYSALSLNEKDVFHGWATRIIIGTEQALQMHDSDLMPTEAWVVWEAFAVALITSDGGAQWWTDYGTTFSRAISDHLNKSVGNIGADHPSIYDLMPHWRSDDA